MRTFVSLHDVLPLALGQVASKTGAAQPLAAVWAELVGPAIAGNASPEALILGDLKVVTQNRAWAEELARRAPELLPRLQARLGGPQVIRSLSFRVKA